MIIHLADAEPDTTVPAIIAEGAPFDLHRTENGAIAEAFVFLREDWKHIRNSIWFKSYPEKCIAFSEWDKPSFFVPGIYASNERRWYARGRSLTIHYPIVQRDSWNEWVTRLADTKQHKTYLYSFMGKSSSRVRQRLLRHYLNKPPIADDVLIETTNEKVSRHVVYDANSRRRYAEVLAASKYALCPRGWGTSSVRLFEACEMGVAPVILSDRWVPIDGIDWTFAIFVAERKVRDLDHVIRFHESEWAERGRLARQTFLRNFTRNDAPRVLAEKTLELDGWPEPQA